MCSANRGGAVYVLFQCFCKKNYEEGVLYFTVCVEVFMKRKKKT